MSESLSAPAWTGDDRLVVRTSCRAWCSTRYAQRGVVLLTQPAICGSCRANTCSYLAYRQGSRRLLPPRTSDLSAMGLGAVMRGSSPGHGGLTRPMRPLRFPAQHQLASQPATDASARSRTCHLSGSGVQPWRAEEVGSRKEFSPSPLASERGGSTCPQDLFEDLSSRPLGRLLRAPYRRWEDRLTAPALLDARGAADLLALSEESVSTMAKRRSHGLPLIKLPKRAHPLRARCVARLGKGAGMSARLTRDARWTYDPPDNANGGAAVRCANTIKPPARTRRYRLHVGRIIHQARARRA